MGRQREFDVEQALDAALCVFWRMGYEGASYSDLTQAIGVERPALYAAFGNKEALFLKALERYYSRYLHFFPQALQLPTAREVVATILHNAVKVNTQFPEHGGCLAVHGALVGGEASEPVRQALAAAREKGEILLRERLQQAQREGDLPAEVDCVTLSAYVCAVIHGMAVQAKAGFPREKLQGIADLVLAMWPAGAPTGADPVTSTQPLPVH